MDREVPTATNLEIRKFHCCFFLEFRVIIVCENLILKKKKSENVERSEGNE